MTKVLIKIRKHGLHLGLPPEPPIKSARRHGQRRTSWSPRRASPDGRSIIKASHAPLATMGCGGGELVVAVFAGPALGRESPQGRHLVGEGGRDVHRGE
jgi:hypothetical protein